MKRILLLTLFIICTFIYPLNATETIKISELGEATSATGDDLLVIVNDPGGSPVTKNITATNLIW